MQEEVEQKSLTLAINTGKMTGRVLRSAVAKFVAHRKAKQPGVAYRGKQTMKQLIGQNQGVSNVELSDRDAREFNRILRDYGVDYAIKKANGQDKFLVFFKARDADAINAALEEFAGRKMEKSKRPSVLSKLRSLVPVTGEPVRQKQREQSR